MGILAFEADAGDLAVRASCVGSGSSELTYFWSLIVCGHAGDFDSEEFFHRFFDLLLIRGFQDLEGPMTFVLLFEAFFRGDRFFDDCVHGDLLFGFFGQKYFLSLLEGVTDKHDRVIFQAVGDVQVAGEDGFCIREVFG